MNMEYQTIKDNGRVKFVVLPVKLFRRLLDRLQDESDLSAIREASPDEFTVLSGEDACTCEMLKLGARGVISVTANVAPAMMSRFCTAYLEGNTEKAEDIDQRLQPLHAMLFVESNPIPVKWALHQMGLIDASIRLPLTPLAEQFREPLAELLRELELM